jgi:hypothetical protein
MLNRLYAKETLDSAMMESDFILLMVLSSLNAFLNSVRFGDEGRSWANNDDGERNEAGDRDGEAAVGDCWAQRSSLLMLSFLVKTSASSGGGVSAGSLLTVAERNILSIELFNDRLELDRESKLMFVCVGEGGDNSSAVDCCLRRDSLGNGRDKDRAVMSSAIRVSVSIVRESPDIMEL